MTGAEGKRERFSTWQVQEHEDKKNDDMLTRIMPYLQTELEKYGYLKSRRGQFSIEEE